MIRYTDQESVKNQIFQTPFQQALNKKNRWMKLSELIPWDDMAKIFMRSMKHGVGRTTVDLRTVMGAMIIQHSLNITDRETLDRISENIYLQYFVGLPSFQTTPVFDHSLLSIFRQRLGEDGAQELNNILVSFAFDSGAIKHRKARTSTKKQDDNQDKDKGDHTGSNSEKELVKTEAALKNKGTIKIDATVVPQNITYPTDTKLLNHSREISECIIDVLFETCRDVKGTKPRTYRREARKKWLQFSKNRKPKRKAIRRQIKTDLNYLNRNLNHIDKLIGLIQESGLKLNLPEHLRKKMYVISEIYRQQKVMYTDGRKKIKDRIVNVAQPWVRPIVRGKAGSPVEFGAKINLSLTEKMVKVDHSSFDAYNEGNDLIGQLEGYRAQYGYYPEYALVDKIYMTRANRKFMKENKIKHTGPALGRRRKISKEERQKTKRKNNERNHIEGKIGQGKVKYGWDNLRTKTAQSSLCVINLVALVMNLEVLLKASLCLILTRLRTQLINVIEYLTHKPNLVLVQRKISNSIDNSSKLGTTCVCTY